MQTKNLITKSDLTFTYLPSFAGYLLSFKLKEYVIELLRICREKEVPILRLFKDFTEDELIQYLTDSATEFLTCLANNKAEQQINQSIRNWKANQLSFISQKDIKAEDITTIAYARKTAFLYFIPQYTSSIEDTIELIKEIDQYILTFETASTNTYFNLLQERINEDAHFIHKINNTSPSGIYVFDLLKNEGVYSNENLSSVLGYTQKELNDLGLSFINQYIHPDDASVIKTHLEEIRKARDGEIKSYKYRIKNKDGVYQWIRHYESVFKRTPDGKAWQTIGIAINVDKEKRTADELKKREAELLEAQQIAQLGSFSWDFTEKKTRLSPQAQAILEVGPDDMEGLLSRVHPQDREKVESELKKAIEQTGYYECEYRYQGKEKQKRILSRGAVTYKEDRPVCMNGTVMDISERAELLEQLTKSQELFKQAQSLGHIGSWNWNRQENKLIGSDEAYLLFNLEPGKEITIEEIGKYIHPDDRFPVEQAIRHSIQRQDPYDVYFRIVLPNGVQKTLHAKGNAEGDTEGNLLKIYGTLQDVTERQTLINRLQYTEKVYKQAEVLANMGNWSWILQTNKIEWTDQLYAIYGLPPQSEEITIERFLSFVHPDDKKFVEEGIDELYKNQTVDYTFRIITADGTVKTLRSIAHMQYDDSGKPTAVFGTERDVTEMQSLIKKLQESDRLYKQAQALAKVGNWFWDIMENRVDWSDELYKIYGLEPQSEMINYETYLSFIHPDDVNLVTSYIEKSLTTHEPYNFSHRIYKKDGTEAILNSTGEVLLNEIGIPYMMVGTAQDITEHQVLINRLKESETLSQQAQAIAHIGNWTYELPTGEYKWSDELYNIYNIPRERMLSYEEVTNYIHPDDREETLAYLQHCIETGKDYDKYHRIILDDGEIKTIHRRAKVIRDEKGNPVRLVGTTQDVTEQHRIQQELKDNQNFIRKIADASPTILYLFDVPTNRFIYINKEIYFVLGYTIDEVLKLEGAVVDFLYHPEDVALLPERKASPKKFQSANSMMQYECRLKSNTDEWCWVLVREVVFKTDEEGKVLQVLGAALDISKRKEMEKTLLQNSFQLEQSNASLEEFAYVASHDLKEPLRKISTFGDRLIHTQGEKLSEDGRIYLKKIIDASQRMQTMINDILSISLISGDRSFQLFSLQAILEEVKHTLEFKMESKYAVLEAPHLPEANIIPSQFRQLFQNLISNSLKFTNEGVQPFIRIRYSYLKPADVNQLQLPKAPAYLKLEFEDNGIGFEDEYAGKIFQIFQRLHGRSEFEGTGIGLAICKKIVEHHGGVIYASAIPGKGAIFTIILPS